MTRLCCYCEVEFGIKPKTGDRVSHGACRRHLIEQYKLNGFDDKIKELEEAKEEEFCFDMSQVFDG